MNRRKHHRFELALVLLVGVALTACSGYYGMHTPKRAQLLHGNENVLVIAPSELDGAGVWVDDRLVGYMWSASDLRATGVDHYYQPSLPVDVSSDASATRIHVLDGTHVLQFKSPLYAVITRTIDAATARPVLVSITSNELKPWNTDGHN